MRRIFATAPIDMAGGNVGLDDVLTSSRFAQLLACTSVENETGPSFVIATA
jgi:hypothetical protein